MIGILFPKLKSYIIKLGLYL